MIKTFSELLKLHTFEERFRYLMLDGKVGESTFGSHRYLNQRWYTSCEWLKIKDYIISRDDGCDLGIEGREIDRNVIIHHINPITIDDIVNHTYALTDPYNLITTVLRTHNAIHYGDEGILLLEPIQRSRYDTCPWKGVH